MSALKPIVLAKKAGIPALAFVLSLYAAAVPSQDARAEGFASCVQGRSTITITCGKGTYCDDGTGRCLPGEGDRGGTCPNGDCGDNSMLMDDASQGPSSCTKGRDRLASCVAGVNQVTVVCGSGYSCDPCSGQCVPGAGSAGAFQNGNGGGYQVSF